MTKLYVNYNWTEHCFEPSNHNWDVFQLVLTSMGDDYGLEWHGSHLNCLDLNCQWHFVVTHFIEFKKFRLKIGNNSDRQFWKIIKEIQSDINIDQSAFQNQDNGYSKTWWSSKSDHGVITHFGWFFPRRGMRGSIFYFSIRKTLFLPWFNKI